MKKNRKLLTGLLALLGLCVIAIAGLQLAPILLAEPESESTSTETIVVQLPVETVERVVWSQGVEDTFQLEKGTDDLWHTSGEGSTVIDQDKAAAAISALCQIVSSREITEPEDPQVYGLSPAQRRVDITLINGGQVTYYLGSINSYTNRYYFQIDGDETVYTVGYSVGETMKYTVLDYVGEPTLPAVGVTFLDSIALDGDAAQRYLSYYSNGNDAYYSDSIHWFEKIDGTSYPMDSERVEECIAYFTLIQFMGCVTLSPTEEECVSWGLDSPISLTAQFRPDSSSTDMITVDDLQFTLLIGDQSEGGDYYVQETVDGPVYLMDEYALEGLLRLYTEDFTPTTIAPIDPTQVLGIQIETADSLQSLQLTWENNQLVSATQGAGSTVDAEQISIWLDGLSTLQAQKLLSEAPAETGDLLGSILLDYDNSQYPVIQLDLYQYSPAYVLISTEECGQFLVLPQTGDTLLTLLN